MLLVGFFVLMACVIEEMVEESLPSTGCLSVSETPILGLFGWVRNYALGVSRRAGCNIVFFFQL